MLKSFSIRRILKTLAVLKGDFIRLELATLQCCRTLKSCTSQIPVCNRNIKAGALMWVVCFPLIHPYFPSGTNGNTNLSKEKRYSRFTHGHVRAQARMHTLTHTHRVSNFPLTYIYSCSHTISPSLVEMIQCSRLFCI